MSQKYTKTTMIYDKAFVGTNNRLAVPKVTPIAMSDYIETIGFILEEVFGGGQDEEDK